MSSPLIPFGPLVWPFGAGHPFVADTLIAGGLILTSSDGPINGDPLAILDGSDDLGTLAQAVLISLFSWRRAASGDALPDAGDLKGWWADGLSGDGDQIGSRLWQLARERIARDTPTVARQYAEEALAWIVADGLAARVDVDTAATGQALALGVTVWRDDGKNVSLKFADLWSAING